MDPAVQPQPTAPAQSTNPTAITKDTSVVYLKGRSTFSGVSAILRMVGSRVQLFEMDPKTGQAVAQVFDVEIHEITKAKVSATYLYLYIGTTRYILNMTLGGTAAMAGAGVVGMVIASRAIKKSDLGWWRDTLVAAGVPLKNWSYGKLTLIGFGIGIAIIILIVIIVIATGGAK